METWTPLTLFWVCCGLSSAVNLGALSLTQQPITIRAIIGAIFFHGLMGGGLSIGLYESFSWARKPGVAIFAAIAYGGGAIAFPDVRAVAQRILGNDKP